MSFNLIFESKIVFSFICRSYLVKRFHGPGHLMWSGPRGGGVNW